MNGNLLHIITVPDCRGLPDRSTNLLFCLTNGVKFSAGPWEGGVAKAESGSELLSVGTLLGSDVFFGVLGWSGCVELLPIVCKNVWWMTLLFFDGLLLLGTVLRLIDSLLNSLWEAILFWLYSIGSFLEHFLPMQNEKLESIFGLWSINGLWQPIKFCYCVCLI